MLVLLCRNRHLSHHEFVSFIVGITVLDTIVELPLIDDCIVTLLFTIDRSSSISITFGDILIGVCFD